MNSFEQLTEGSNKSPIDFDNLLASLATDGPCDWNQDVAHTEPQNFQVDTHQFSDPNPTYATIDIVEALRKDLDDLRREYSTTQTACYEHDTKFSIMQENLEAFMMRVHKLERRVDDIAHGKVRVQPQQDSIVVSTPVTVVSASPGPPSPQESQSSSPSSATTAQVVTEHGITFSAELTKFPSSPSESSVQSSSTETSSLEDSPSGMAISMAFGLDFPRIGDTTGKRPTFYPHQIRDPRTDTKVLRYLGGLNKAHLTLIITDLLGLMMNIRVVMPCLEGEKEPSISMTLTEPTTISTIAPSPSPSPSPFPRHPLSQPQPSTPQSATLPSSSHLRVSTPTIQPNDGLLTPRRSVSPYSPRGRSPLAASCVPASAARPFTASIIVKPSPTYPQQTLSPTPVRPGPASLDIAAATQPTSVHNKKPVVATNRPTQSGSQPINVSAQSQPMAGQKRKAMASTMPTQTTVLQASNLLMGSSSTAEWVGSPESVSSGGFSSPVSQQSVALQHQVQSQYYSQHLAVPEGLGSPFDGRLLKRQRYNPGQVLGWPPTDLS